jgi:hypothetical protein
VKDRARRGPRRRPAPHSAHRRGREIDGCGARRLADRVQLLRVANAVGTTARKRSSGSQQKRMSRSAAEADEPLRGTNMRRSGRSGSVRRFCRWALLASGSWEISAWPS